jgi:hypothetical protein
MQNIPSHIEGELQNQHVDENWRESKLILKIS